MNAGYADYEATPLRCGRLAGIPRINGGSGRVVADVVANVVVGGWQAVLVLVWWWWWLLLWWFVEGSLNSWEGGVMVGAEP